MKRQKSGKSPVNYNDDDGADDNGGRERKRDRKGRGMPV